MFASLKRVSFNSKKGISRYFSSSLAQTSLTPNVTRLDVSSNDNESSLSTRKSVQSVQAAILDWSGTTADAHVLAPAVVFFDVFEKHGVPISMIEAREPMGLRKDLHIAKILEMPQVKQRWIEAKGEQPTQATVDMLFKDFVPKQLEVLGRYTTLLPGVAETIDTLKNGGVQIGSTTGFTKVMVDILLRDAAKQGYVPDSSVAGDQVSPSALGFRPAPFMLYQNLNNLGVWPVDTVVKVDDTVSGVGEGLSAGCWTVGVYAWSNYTNVDSLEQWDAMSDDEQKSRQEISKQKLLNSGAHYVAYDLRDLPMIVEDINDRMKRGETPTSTAVSVPKSI